MEILLIILASVAEFILLLYAIFNKKKRRAAATGLNDNERSVLKEYVSFYNELDEVKKKEFENRVQHFLATTKITGINTDV